MSARRRKPAGFEAEGSEGPRLETKAGLRLETKRARLGSSPAQSGSSDAEEALEAGAGEPKWRRRADERPDEILDAALDAFTEEGFDATRVEDVARRAGISKAGLYLYFASKEDLLRALIEREVAPIARTIRALAEGGLDDPAGTLGGLIAGISAVFAERRRFAVPRIVLAVAGQFPEIAAYYRTNVADEALAAFILLHEAGVARGVFRDVDPAMAARAVLGPLLLDALFSHVLGGDGRTPDPHALFDLVMNGLAEVER